VTLMIKYCPAILASCQCKFEAGHEGPHVCECKGSWEDNGNILAFPDLSGGFGSVPRREVTND